MWNKKKSIITSWGEFLLMDASNLNVIFTLDLHVIYPGYIFLVYI